jgi:HSP20 family molecular chaperone IbpA
MTVGDKLSGRGHIASLRGCDRYPSSLPPVRDGEGLPRLRGALRPIPSLLPNWAESAATPCQHARKAKTMALSEFPRLGFDPFVELRECKVRCLPFSADQHPAGRQQRGLTDELPEVTPSDVTVNLAGRVLTVVGARRPRNEQNANWQRQERTNGSFAYRPTAVPDRCR